MKLKSAKTLEMDQMENVAGGGYFHHPDHGRDDIVLPDAPPPCPPSTLTATDQVFVVNCRFVG